MAPTGRTGVYARAGTWGLDVEFTDTTDPGVLASAIRPGRTRLLWVETPANPMWEITDLAAACELAHSAGVRVAVDNPDGDRYLGFIFAEGDTCEGVEKALGTAREQLRVVIE
jgi:O-acetylhomoserine/O-acetylserine sulfhydrylase-like pyridoxal-dependent enzyme